MTQRKRIALGLVLLTLSGSCAWAGNPIDSPNDPFITWIDREWEYRYLLVVEGRWKGMQKKQQDDWIKRPAHVANQQIEGHFDPTLQLIPPSEAMVNQDERNVLRLDVARDRTVLQPTLQGKTVEARLNDLRDIVLAAKGESSPSFTINFGTLFLGTYAAADPAYSPSICTNLDLETDTRYPGRYLKGYKADSDEGRSGHKGYFGCREWAAQLYDRDRPYIDVTSYEWGPDFDKPEKKGKYPVGAVAYIKPFIGFSRFQDAPKPVIGKDRQQWYCLTDCPEGTTPGKIDDIASWAKTRGWPVPKRPKNVRQYINKEMEAIDYRE